MKKYLQIICGLILCCTMLLTGCGQGGGQSSDTAANSKVEAKGQLTISMLDIGQGDAVLIQTGAKNILIDTGDDKYYEDGKKGKETRHITLAYFEQKSTVDYIGAVQGIPVCFDAKECNTDTFPPSIYLPSGKITWCACKSWLVT